MASGNAVSDTNFQPTPTDVLPSEPGDGSVNATEAGAEEVVDEAEASAEDLEIPDLVSKAGEATAEGETGKPGGKQAESVFAELMKKEFGPQEPKPEELPPEVKPGSRAAQDIIALRQRAQRAETEIGNYQRVMQQRDAEVQGYLGQVQQQMQTLAQENAEMRGRLTEISRRPVGPQPEPNSYLDNLMKKVGTEVLDPQLRPLAQRLDAAEQRAAAAEKKQADAERAAQTTQVAQAIHRAAAQTFLQNAMPGVPQEELMAPDPIIGDSLANMGTVLTLAMMRAANAEGTQADFNRATQLLRRFTLLAADKITRHAKAQTRASIDKQNQEAPPTISRSGVGGKIQEQMPGPYTLHENGFQTPMDWIDAGSPRLKVDPRDKQE